MKKIYRYILIFILAITYLLPFTTDAATGKVQIGTDLTVEYTVNASTIDFKSVNTAPNESGKKNVVYALTVSLAKAPIKNNTYEFIERRGTKEKPLYISNISAVNSNFGNLLAQGQFKNLAKGKYVLVIEPVRKAETYNNGSPSPIRISTSYIHSGELTVTGVATTNTTTNTANNNTNTTNNNTNTTTNTSASPCKITSASWDPSGEQKEGFFTEGSKYADIVVKSIDCVGKTGVKLTIHESDGLTSITDDVWDDSGLYNLPITVPTNNFKIRVLLGEEDCDRGSIGFNCDLYFKINQGNGRTYSSTSSNGGWLWYYCDGVCMEEGRFEKIIPEGDKAISLDAENEQGMVNKATYKLLAPIGSLKEVRISGGVCPVDKSMPNGIGCYFNTIFKIAIALCAALAVVMTIIAGIQYIGDDSIFGKTEAKSKIQSYLLGLLIALGAFALLNTIDPALTGKDGLNVDTVEGEIIEGDAQAPVTVDTPMAKSLGIMCPGSGGKQSVPNIAKSFSGRMTYSQDIPKGKSGPNGTIKLDCSGYVNYVLKCAGVNNKKINTGTYGIFQGSEKVKDKKATTDTSINGIALEKGDLVGWPPQDDPKKSGHVMIYIGDGLVADSHGGEGRTPGKAYGSFGLTKYKDRITSVRRVSSF